MEPTPRVAEALERLKSLFLENPATRLTVDDASQLSGLDASVCELLLLALEDVRFLTRVRDGAYLRPTIDTPES